MKELENDKLCWLHRSEANLDVDDAEVDIVLSCYVAVAPDRERLTKGLALKRSLAEEIVHESPHVQGNLGSERFIIRFKDNPFDTAIQSFLYKESETADGDVFPFASDIIFCPLSVSSVECDKFKLGMPGELVRIDHGIIFIRQSIFQGYDSSYVHIHSCRCLPKCLAGIGASHHTGKSSVYNSHNIRLVSVILEEKMQG